MKNAIRLPAIALAALLPLSAVADRLGPDGMDSKRRLDKMQEELDLSGDQRDELEAIFDDHRRKMLDLRQDTEGKINDVLSAEQREKLDDMQDNRKKRFEKWREKKQSENGPGSERQQQWQERMRDGGWSREE